MKIIDKLLKAIKEKHVLFSFEYTCPRTADGVRNLCERLDRMGRLEPAWLDCTWRSSTSALTLEVCKYAQNLVGLEIMMHLTCTNLPATDVHEALRKAKEAGLQNVLALRGDPPLGQQWRQIEGGFSHAVNLVRYIRQSHGTYFGVCVAGYPEGHLDATSYAEDVRHLKEKVDAGADFIITQLFYDVDLFLQWQRDVRATGVTCPIVPGIMPIQTYAGFQRMTTLCKIRVPQAIRDALEPIKDNDEAVSAFGVELAVEMCRKLLDAGVPALHFYTMNLERSVMQILAQLGLSDHVQLRKALPWRPSPSVQRSKENVRPIFWNNRPKSYVCRTACWADYPCGRWGLSRRPFGQLSEVGLGTTTSVDPKALWGEPAEERDVWEVFARYLRGECPRLPWSDQPLAAETAKIQAPLMALNQQGYCTINSQPRVNAAPSDDPIHGWGGPGGWVYQKAYLEFLTSPEHLARLVERIHCHNASSRAGNHVSWMATNSHGDSQGNFTGTDVVTWGVFPGREVLQPTVVDSYSFLVWKDEAFALWRSQWVQAYDKGSSTCALLERLYDSYFLVSLVDDNFVSGDIFALFAPSSHTTSSATDTTAG